MRSAAPVQSPKQERKDLKAIPSTWVTAETVVDALEDADDYGAFGMAVTADADA